MKKIIISLALAALAGQAWGRTLTPAEALSRAMGDTPAKVGAMSGSARDIKPLLTVNDKLSGTPSLYVLTPGSGEGFLIVSADDAAAPLLGYSDNGVFDPQNVPDNMRWWMDQLAEEIAFGAANGLTFETSTSKAFSRPAVSPKIATRWNQDAPYNNDCPTLGGMKCATGCVATAMAQIINYHKWPEKGVGTHSYNWVNGSQTLSFDYGNTTFDWANMLDVYTSTATEAQTSAVATLMYACGVGVNMSYHYEASGAVSAAVAPAMREYFNYDKGIRTLIRSTYSAEEWMDIIYTELTENGPVYYAGQGAEGGHAFVCDGFADGYFHFNWGWGGMSDGYFLLNALNPASQGIGGYSTGFNQRQTIVTGVRKPQPDSQLPPPNLALNNPINVYKSGTSITVTGPFNNYSPYTIKGSFCVRFVNIETGEVLTRSNISKPQIDPGYFLRTFTVNPSNLPDGSYRGQVGFNIDGTFYPVTPCLGDTGYILLTKEGTSFTVEAERVGSLKFSSLEALSPFYAGKVFGLKANYTLDSETAMLTTLVPTIQTTTGATVAEGEEFETEIAPGTGSLEYTGTLPTNLQPGDYVIVLSRSVGLSSTGSYTIYEPVSDPLPITVGKLTWDRAAILTCNSSAWSVKDAENVDPSALTINATFQVAMGYYAGPIMACIFDGDLASSNATPARAIASFYSGNYFVDENQSADAVITGDFLQAIPGTTYKVKLFTQGGTSLSSDVKTFTVGNSTAIDDIDADTNAGPVEYFNLQGVRVENPSQGLYIRRQGDKAEKVYIR